MAEVVTIHQRFNNLREIVERFPLKCRLFMSLLLSHLPQGSNIQIPKDFKQAYSLFTHTFDKFSSDEKLYFIGQISSHISTSLQKGKL